MSAAYCSYCDADTEAGQICAECGRGRGSLFPAVLSPQEVAELCRKKDRPDWTDQYLQRPEPRGDRLIIDDPHGTANPEETAAARARFAETCARIPKDGPAVIIMARMHREVGE